MLFGHLNGIGNIHDGVGAMALISWVAWMVTGALASPIVVGGPHNPTYKDVMVDSVCDALLGGTENTWSSDALRTQSHHKEFWWTNVKDTMAMIAPD